MELGGGEKNKLCDTNSGAHDHCHGHEVGVETVDHGHTHGHVIGKEISDHGHSHQVRYCTHSSLPELLLRKCLRETLDTGDRNSRLTAFSTLLTTTAHGFPRVVCCSSTD